MPTGESVYTVRLEGIDQANRSIDIFIGRQNQMQKSVSNTDRAVQGLEKTLGGIGTTLRGAGRFTLDVVESFGVLETAISATTLGLIGKRGLRQAADEYTKAAEIQVDAVKAQTRAATAQANILRHQAGLYAALIAPIERLRMIFGRLGPAVLAFLNPFTKLRVLLAGATTVLAVTNFTRALHSMRNATIEAGFEIALLSDRLDLNATTVSRWEIAARRSFTTVEAFTGAYSHLNMEILRASAGIEESVNVFDELGISVGKLAALGPDDRLAAVADVIANIRNPADRSAASLALLGAEGEELEPVFRKGAEGFRELIAESERYNPVSDSAADATLRLKQRHEELKLLQEAQAREIAEELIPAYNALDEVKLLKLRAELFAVQQTVGYIRQNVQSLAIIGSSFYQARPGTEFTSLSRLLFPPGRQLGPQGISDAEFAAIYGTQTGSPPLPPWRPSTRYALQAALAEFGAGIQEPLPPTPIDPEGLAFGNIPGSFLRSQVPYVPPPTDDTTGTGATFDPAAAFRTRASDLRFRRQGVVAGLSNFQLGQNQLQRERTRALEAGNTALADSLQAQWDLNQAIEGRRLKELEAQDAADALADAERMRTDRLLREESLLGSLRDRRTRGLFLTGDYDIAQTQLRQAGIDFEIQNATQAQFAYNEIRRIVEFYGRGSQDPNRDLAVTLLEDILKQMEESTAVNEDIKRSLNQVIRTQVLNTAPVFDTGFTDNLAERIRQAQRNQEISLV